MSRSSKTKTWLGIPYNWKWPGWGAVWENSWDKRSSARMFPPKVWGAGWSFNFAYALIPSKPLLHRLAAFITGLLIVLLLLYVIVVAAMIAYFLLTPAQPQTPVFEIVLE